MSRHSQFGEAFSEEMSKIALDNRLVSALVGGVGGATLNAGRRYMGARSEGKGVVDSLGEAGKGALTGGAAGALTVGGLAAGSHALRGGAPVTFDKFVNGAVQQGTPMYQSLDQAVGDFGRRAVHSLTGWTPEVAKTGPARASWLRSIGVGGRDPGGTIQAAKHHAAQVAAGADERGLFKPTSWLPQGARQYLADKDVINAQRTVRNDNKMIAQGLTSLPGVVRGLAGPNRGDVAKTMMSSAWHGGGGFGKAMMGLGAVDLYHNATAPQDPNDPRGRAERIGGSLGNIAGGLIPGTVPMVGQYVGGNIIGKGFSTVGKAIDSVTGGRPRVVGPRQDPTDPVASTAHQTGPEVVMSPAAAGSPYGGGVA